MDIFISFIITGMTAFLIGSIPTGFLVARFQGIDIRAQGSGNIGATNAFRVLGKVWGTVVLLVDLLKGTVPVLIVHFLFIESPALVYLMLFTAVCVVLGHNFTPWLKFKGGKGIATSAGALLGLMPLVFVLVIGTFLVVFFLSRYVSVGSLTAAFLLPVYTILIYWQMESFWPYTIFSLILGGLAILRHKGNIQRLMNGTESRFGKKKEQVTT